ncbi:hypothetical protein GEMRC1_002339 [Eukaryota sp. GEM-RC1]
MNLIVAANRLHPQAFVSASCSAFPSSVMTAGNDGSLILSDVERLSAVRVFNSRQTRAIYALDHHPSLHVAAFGGLERRIGLIDPYVATPVGLLEGHSSPILSVGFSHEYNNSNFLVSSAMDKTVKLWDIRMMKCLQTERDCSRHIPVDEFKSSVFIRGQEKSPNLGLMVTAGSTIRMWPLSYDSIGLARSHDRPIKIDGAIVAFLFSSSFNVFCAIHADYNMFLYELSGDKLVQKNRLMIKSCEGKVTSACCQNDGRLILVTNDKGNVYFVHILTGAVLSTLPPLFDDITQIKNLNNLSFYGSVCIGCHGLVCLIPLYACLLLEETPSKSTTESKGVPALLEEVHGSQDVIAVDFLESDSILVTADAEGLVAVWNLRFRTVDYTFTFNTFVTQICILPNRNSDGSADVIVTTGRSQELDSDSVMLGSEIWHIKLSNGSPVAYSMGLLQRSPIDIQICEGFLIVLDASGKFLVFNIEYNADVMRLFQITSKNLPNVNYSGFYISAGQRVLIVYGESLQIVPLDSLICCSL